MAGLRFRRGRGTAGRPRGPLEALYQTPTIVQQALLEGAAFFQVIAYLLEGQPLNLGLTLGLILRLTLLFPKREAVERWIGTQRDRMERRPDGIPA